MINDAKRVTGQELCNQKTSWISFPSDVGIYEYAINPTLKQLKKAGY
jgi:hypothetical protein